VRHNCVAVATWDCIAIGQVPFVTESAVREMNTLSAISVDFLDCGLTPPTSEVPRHDRLSFLKCFFFILIHRPIRRQVRVGAVVEAFLDYERAVAGVTERDVPVFAVGNIVVTALTEYVRVVVRVVEVVQGVAVRVISLVVLGKLLRDLLPPTLGLRPPCCRKRPAVVFVLPNVLPLLKSEHAGAVCRLRTAAIAVNDATSCEFGVLHESLIGLEGNPPKSDARLTPVWVGEPVL